MLYFYSGTDREKSRAQMNAAIKKHAKSANIFRVSDVNTVDDLKAGLQGGGMFDGARSVVYDGVFANQEMAAILLSALDQMKKSVDIFFILEEKVDASTRKQIEKYAETSEKYDAPKKKESGTTIFALANALKARDKKALWVGYQRELLGSAPEAIHGVLFWGAKQMALTARSESEKSRAQKIIAQLAKLPHESRRQGMELEYALEQFVLSGA